MFTGIVTAIGRIVAAEPLGPGPAHGKRLILRAPAGYVDDVAPGDSVAINGACMTATAVDATASRFTVEVSAESLDKTAGLAGEGEVNLEKALRAGDRLGGHLVSGHVDGVGTVTHMAPVGESCELRILAPTELGRFLAYKGSIAVNGVSLTVNRVHDSAEGSEFSINLVAHTLQHTTLRGLSAGDRVNLEIDLIARYVERMLGGAAASRAMGHPIV